MTTRSAILLLALPLAAQQVINLRPPTPGAPPETIVERGTAGVTDRAISAVSQPTVTLYLPESASSARGAIIIAPGGAYRHLAIDKEGHEVARWLQSIGWAGIVLKYRLPGGNAISRLDTFDQTAEAARLPFEDAVAAVRLVRASAAKWNLQPNRIGIMGFSAGGNLAALMGARAPEDARPDFLVLAYPAIPKVLDDLPATVPPAFLVHADDDRLGAEANSVPFYLAMKRLKRPAELHVYAAGGHGFGIRKTEATSANWPAALEAWLRRMTP